MPKTDEPDLHGVQVKGEKTPASARVLTPDAVAFVAEIVRLFRPRVTELLAARKARQARFDKGEKPDFLAETKSVREGTWTVAPMPKDLQDRRVEITGPTERKMIINALNSGASVFMADFEDSNSPTWDNGLVGQVNLQDAVRRTITYEDPHSKKSYRLNDKIATLLVRPRGWHLTEASFLVDGERAPAGLVDFGLYFFHNAKELLARGAGPYFYLPKMQSHLEARLWNDVFVHAQKKLGIPNGTIKATVLIETLPAAFEMDEILYELRDHSIGLNCGRWDYIFSFIKTMRGDASFVLPDRAQVTMEQACMRAYTQLVVKTCHKRETFAMGGMAAQIPIKNDPAKNEAALAKVRADKLREVKDGHDGTWVAHPGLVPIAKEIFDAHMKTPNQIANKRLDVNVSARDLLRVPEGTHTLAGLRQNVDVGIQYLAAWLGGVGCVPLHNLMEDAATAEISRTQVWQWLKYGVVLDDGQKLTRDRFLAVVQDEVKQMLEGADRVVAARVKEAQELFVKLSTAEECQDFLTLPAYERLVASK